MFWSGKRKNELLELLTPVRKRLFYKNTFFYCFSFSFVGTAVGAIILLLSRFQPIPYIREATIALIVLSAIGGIIYSSTRKPDHRMAAAHADKQGSLLEKVMTAFEHQENPSRTAQWQREDAIDSLRKKLPYIVESIHLWPFTRKQILVFSGIFTELTDEKAHV
jgi:outer membrane protein assembly factor BamE (lipoprotein component of BamABCDE complex)